MSSRDADARPVSESTTPSASAIAPEERERELSRERLARRAAGEPDDRAERAWRAASATAGHAFVALAENVRDYAIFLMDPEGVITFWGEGARLIKWWSREDTEGAHLRMLYPANGSEDGTADDHLRQAALHGEYTGEGCRVRADGSTFWAGVTLTALRDAQGTLLGFAKVTRDLTARRAADEMMRAAAAAAERARLDAETANMAKSGFLATMSHEIRTPVNAIIGYLDLLRLEVGGPLTDEQRAFVERADRGSRHLVSLVSEVLDFSRIEAKRAPIARQVVRVGDVVEQAFALVAPQASARGVELVDSVNGYAGGLAAWGDAARVTQVMVNLLVNAIKFTDARDGEAGRITVSAGTTASPPAGTRLEGAGPWVYLRVEDTGSGIATDQLERIFEPFVQADMTLTRPHGGTGLGLAISRELARAMDGDVVARSEMDVGSTFILWLDAAPVESLHTGGIEGHGPPAESAHHVTPPVEATVRPSEPGALRSIADALNTDLVPIMRAYVTRVRAEISVAAPLPDADIEDHLGSFIADIAGSLAGVDATMGMPAEALTDGTAIQRVIAERHGVQRARLGWSGQDVRIGFRILREELGAALRRRVSDQVMGPTRESRIAEVTRAMELVDQFLQVAERLSIDALRRGVRA